MVTRRCIAGLLSAMLVVCVAGTQASMQTQSDGPSEPLAALRQGQLTVWFIGAPARPPETNLQAIAALHHATPLTYQEKESGGFGQEASTFGQNSGNYGEASDTPSISTPHSAPGQDAPSGTPNGIGYKEQEAGSFGQESSSTGTEASNYGTPGTGTGQNGKSFSQEASSYGTEASNHGTEASSFGNSTSTIAGAANSAPKPQGDPVAEDFKERLQHAFPELQLNFTEVDPNELKSRLIATQGSASYPDVLVGAIPEAWWSGMQSQFGLAMLRPASFFANGVTQHPRNEEGFAILAKAQHMRAAREFALWMSEPYSGCPGCVQSVLTLKEMAAAAVAISAVEHLLSEEPLGDEADPEMASSSSVGARRMLATIGGTGGGDAPTNVEVERASMNGGLAAVALRVVVSSSHVFGVAHPLVVLRMEKDGKWRILQASMNLQQIEQENVRHALMLTAPNSSTEQRAGVKGVSLAAPPDGTAQAAMPELIWDNNGGAGLQVVEWQISRDHGWSDARLFLVSDLGTRLQTHVRAEFAGVVGKYRWRVWSVGGHGEMKISPWRSFNVAQ